MSEPGYYVERPALRRASSVYGERYDDVKAAEEELRRAFDRDRAALGHDIYGAELAKRLPGIEEGIFGAFDSYLDDLDGTGGGLATAAANYDAVDKPA